MADPEPPHHKTIDNKVRETDRTKEKKSKGQIN
jgi:hypothetical protein